MTNLLFSFILTSLILRPDTALVRGGDFLDLVVVNQRIYGATGRGVVVLDSALHPLASFNSPGIARSIAVDSFVFVADDYNGIVVLDTASLKPVRTMKTGADAQAVRVHPPGLIVGTDSGLAIYAGEANPELTRQVVIPGGVDQLLINGNFIYTINALGITILSLDDSTTPVTSLPFSKPTAIAIGGENLYLARDTGLTIFDLSSPQSPKELKTFIPPAKIEALVVKSPFVYLTTADNKLIIFENRVNQMLSLVKTLPTDAIGHSIALTPNSIFLGTGAGIDRISGANPKEAAITGSFRFDNQGTVTDVTNVGRLGVTVGDGTGMWIFDPAEASVIKRLPALRFARATAASGDSIIFVIDEHLGALGFDLPKPAEPIRNYINSSAREATVAIVAKDRLVVAGPKELHEYEICPCKALSDKTVYNLQTPAFDVAKLGERLYAALGDSGIIGVEGTKSFLIPITAHRMMFKQKTLYTLDRAFGLRIYDAREPKNPKLVSELAITGTPRDFLLHKNNLYIATGKKGIRIINVLNPRHPKEVGSFDTPGEALRLARVGSYLLVADYYSLEILKLPQ